MLLLKDLEYHRGQTFEVITLLFRNSQSALYLDWKLALSFVVGLEKE